MKKHITRRGFIKTTAVGSATALLGACDSDPVENLVPFLVPPDDFVPGKSIRYATTCRECPANCGMVVRTREGRAVKAEGNPEHPLNQGALCAIGQASLQGLYSPARVKGPYLNKPDGKEEITWEQGLTLLADKLSSLNGRQVLYLGRAESGTGLQLLERLLGSVERAKRLVLDFNPVNSLARAGGLVFGQAEIPWFRFEHADAVVNFGADCFESGLSPVESMKTVGSYHYTFIGPRLSLSAAAADSRILCHPGDETAICLALAHILAPRSKSLPGEFRGAVLDFLAPYSPATVAADTGTKTEFLEHTAERIGTDGSSLVIGGGLSTAGHRQTQLQVAVLLLNLLAGNVGKSVVYGTGTTYRQHDLGSISHAVRDMKAGDVGMVIMDNVNPLYSLSEDTGFHEALKKVPHRVSLSTVADESTAIATLHLPVSHPLESWGDAFPRSGVYSIQQPVMATVPGYRTRQRGDLLLSLGRLLKPDIFTENSFYDYLRESWKPVHVKTASDLPFNEFWQASVQMGGAFASVRPEPVELKPFWDRLQFPKTASDRQLTLLTISSPLHDINGYSADKYWLQEIPDPVSQVVWDSWLEIHPKTAATLGIRNGERVELKNPNGATITVGALLYGGIAENAVGLPAGMGRALSFPDYTPYKRDMIIPTRVRDPRRMKTISPGINPAAVLPFKLDPISGDPVLTVPSIRIRGSGEQADLVTIDGHYGLERDPHGKQPDRSQNMRELIRKEGEGRSHHDEKHPHSSRKGLYREMKDLVKSHPFNLEGVDTPEYHDPYRWELVVDLDRCTGCSACVVACYAENNIAVVGKERQAVGREMSWLRIERYFGEDKESGTPQPDFIPQMCAQCDNAGCEPVCPLYATYHNPDGINTMVYARCAGTRYCANNCIYKSRKFNWRSYVFPAPLHLQLNPDVTVRDKGVMEKCTFCIQRIKEAKEPAVRENRILQDGEVLTACQQTCPARAITFGNGQDPASAISRLKKSKRAYRQLEELNFKPAVTYLKKRKRV